MPKGRVVETFIEGDILRPRRMYHTAYAMSGMKSNRYIILVKCIYTINYPNI